MKEAMVIRAVLAALLSAALLGSVTPVHAGAADLMRCQKAVHVRATTFVKNVQTALTNCAFKVESCQLAQEIDGEDVTHCLEAAAASCAGYSGKVPAYKSSAVSKVILLCNSVPLDELQQYVAGLGFATAGASCTVNTVSDLLSCLFDGAQCSAERTVFTLDARAGDALATAGIAAAHPCVAP